MREQYKSDPRARAVIVGFGLDPRQSQRYANAPAIHGHHHEVDIDLHRVLVLSSLLRVGRPWTARVPIRCFVFYAVEQAVTIFEPNVPLGLYLRRALLPSEALDHCTMHCEVVLSFVELLL